MKKLKLDKLRVMSFVSRVERGQHLIGAGTGEACGGSGAAGGNCPHDPPPN